MKSSKERLRHPIRSITEPYGKAGLLVAILALVLATTGAAFAAAGLNSKQKKEVTKIAKKYAGKPGAPGATGPAGTNGTNGKDGANGTAGANGTNGVSAEATSFTGTKKVGSVECKEGGVAVKSASPETAVCNGKNGTTGFTDTLPSGKTEKGTWGATIGKTGVVFSFGIGQAPISFTIPLAAALPEENIQINPVGFPAEPEDCSALSEPEKAECEAKNAELELKEEHCPGTAENPKAAKEFLCIYKTTDSTSSATELINLNSPAGVVINFFSEEEGRFAFGTWAVTAP